MNDKLLIEQLRTLRNIHPDRNWVALTRSQLNNTNPQMTANAANIFDKIFAFGVPRILAIPAMAAIVVLVGGLAFLQNSGQEGVFVASVRHKSLSIETKQELKEIASIASGSDPASGVRPQTGYESDFTVVFDEDSDRQESFKNELRNRIEAKIGKIKDLFAQLENEDLARQILLNPRRLEENFKLADGEIGEQVKSLLAEAEAALQEGNLIDALDMVNAIDKLSESN